MKANLLEIAIACNEVNMFFRGNDRYLVPSPDYDGHVHGAHMGGAARSYAEQSASNTADFDKSFLNFIESLDISNEDLNHLLANLSAYFSQKSRNGFSDSILFDTALSPGSLLVTNYLKRIDQSSFVDNVKSQIHRHAKFIDSKGCSLLNDIISELPNVRE